MRNKEGVSLPEEVLNETRNKYDEARDRLMRRVEAGNNGRKGRKGAEETSMQTGQTNDAIQAKSEKASSTVHGKKGLLADETGLQTDQVADAIEQEAARV